MEKQISFSGVALTPYNDISPDGQLSACCNLERHAGSLRPTVLQGKTYDVSNTNIRLIYIHSTAYYSHFIFYDDSSGNLYWSEQDNTASLSPVLIGTVVGFRSVKSLGNTLVVASGSGVSYFLYSESDQNYNALGDIPHLNLSFGLQARHDNISFIVPLIDKINESLIFVNSLSSDNYEAIYSSAKRNFNKFISEKVKGSEFIYPFFIRYALMLYDGTLVHHSSPVLMMCATDKSPLIYLIGGTKEGGIGEMYNNLIFDVIAPCCSVDMKVSDTSEIQALQKWKDVIKSVRIYFSLPITTVNPDFDSVTLQEDIDDTRYIAKSVFKEISSDYYRETTFKELYKYGGTGAIANPDPLGMLVTNSSKKDEDINEAISSESKFYFATELNIDELYQYSSRQKLSLSDDIRNELPFRELMQDDYFTNDTLIPNFSYIYNQRLIFAGIKRKLFQGFNTEALFCYENGTGGSASEDYLQCYVYISGDAGDIVVENTCHIPVSFRSGRYFFYPNPNAYKAVIDLGASYSSRYRILTLKPHPLLNGAYNFEGLNGGGTYSRYENPVASPEYKRSVNEPNKIYTSEVGNPFYFPLAGINTVGIGEIVGVASVTAALSQGQFGSFPLMAFCTDGNYALQVGNEGLFTGVFPMARDVCINASSITPIDGAVVFVSSRGVMLADGSVINCISDLLNGVPDDLSFVEGVSAFSYTLPEGAPVDFFRTCMIAYDYAGRRLLFFSDEINNDSVWVLSLEDNTWSQTEINGVEAVLNSYPFSYIQKEGGRTIVRLDEAYKYTDADKYQGFVVTRPLKLDTLQYKSLRQVALVGSFSQAQTVGIYGSNDGNNWFLLGKSNAGRILTPGRYFKYYRFSIETNLANSENITGLRVEYDIRPERRFR